MRPNVGFHERCFSTPFLERINLRAASTTFSFCSRTFRLQRSKRFRIVLKNSNIPQYLFDIYCRRSFSYNSPSSGHSCSSSKGPLP